VPSHFVKSCYAKCFWCRRSDGSNLGSVLAQRGIHMIKLLVERDRPPTFNLASDQEVARHARISVNAIAELAGRYHWLCTYATEEKLVSVIVVDDESTYDEWVEKTKAYTVGLKVRRIVRVIDPSLAE
jgi:hypothetical protein